MSQKKYLFDSDSLIIAKKTHYAPEFCMPFWEWLLTGNQQKCFFTIDRVADELMNGNEGDYLREFVEEQDSFILPTKDDSKCLDKYVEIQQWANTKWALGKKHSKITKALEVFAKEKTADSWLVAYASAHGFDIVSNEGSSPESQSRVMLPDAAKALGVRVVKLHEVLMLHSGPNFKYKSK
jgi:hypothetical protein